MSGMADFYDVKFLLWILSFFASTSLVHLYFHTYLPHCPHLSLFYFSIQKFATSTSTALPSNFHLLWVLSPEPSSPVTLHRLWLSLDFAFALVSNNRRFRVIFMKMFLGVWGRSSWGFSSSLGRETGIPVF